MATNKTSCAVCFQFLLSLLLLGFFALVGYSAAGFHGHQDLQGIQGTSRKGNRLVVGFVIVGALLEVVQIVKSWGLHSTYWQQELRAIKEVYSKRQASGIRSRSVNAKPGLSAQKLLRGRNNPELIEVESLLEGAMPGLGKKQEKQLILRKLQYDVVKSYSKLNCIIFGLKVVELIAYFQFTNVFEFILQDSKLGQLSSSKIATRLTDILKQDPFTSKDFMHLGLVLMAARLLELGNHYLIYRWRQNIKRDIFESISQKQPALKASGSLGLGFGDDAPKDPLCDQTTLLGDSEEGGMFLDRHTTLDHESAPLLLSQHYQQFKNRSTKLGGESEHSFGSSSERTRRTTQEPQRMSLSSNYSQAMAKATIVL